METLWKKRRAPVPLDISHLSSEHESKFYSYDDDDDNGDNRSMMMIIDEDNDDD
jgi:hypothetical protein